jgi:hypothetical protein
VTKGPSGNRHLPLTGPQLVATALLVALAAGCGRSSGAVEVTPPEGLGFEPSVAVFHDGLAVSWYDTRHGHGEL